jgi:predicted choloylglycine hydrolase
MFKTLLRFFLSLCFITIVGCSTSVLNGTAKSFKDSYNFKDTITAKDTLRVKVNDSFFRVGKNQLRKNQFGIWEMYLEGNAYQRGLATGSLTRELIEIQEKSLIKKIVSEVTTAKDSVKQLLKFYNNYTVNLNESIPDEYYRELSGLIPFANSSLDTLTQPINRLWYMQALPDITHDFEELFESGCSSFAVWGNKSFDGKLIVARNYDFHINEAFNENKLVTFIKPDNGHRFVTYSWPGFMGVVSGINEYGVTVTINSGLSKTNKKAKTPIGYVAREILQYSKNSYEARRIAEDFNVFASESILVGSAVEREALIIEKSAEKQAVYKANNITTVVCANHFQSETFYDDTYNRDATYNTNSMHRFERIYELLNAEDKMTPKKAVKVLREKRGLQDSLLGFGNKRAINQLKAHHAIVFKPQDYKLWISAKPYNLGKFVSYDVKESFARFEDTIPVNTSVANLKDVIAEDPFLNSETYNNYAAYKSLYNLIAEQITLNQPVPDALLQRLILLNPHQWEAYTLVGDYFYGIENFVEATEKYQAALDLRVNSPKDYKILQLKIDDSLKRLNRLQN